MKKPFYIEKEIKVKGYDIDAAGIVSNIVYIRWLEDLRTVILDRYLPLEELLNESKCPALLETKIKYRRALTIFDKPIGKMWGEEISGLKWKIRAEIWNKNELSAEAEQIGLFINIKTGRPIRIPKEMKEEFENFQK